MSGQRLSEVPICLRRRYSIPAMALATIGTVLCVDTMSGHAAVAARVAMTRASSQGAREPSSARVLGGFTSQGWPIVVLMSKSGKKIAVIGAGLAMSCRSGLRYPVNDGWVHVPIGANGRVKATTSFTPSPGNPNSLTGGTDSLSAKFNRTRTSLAGVWRMHLNYSSSTGRADACDSGAVTFTAVL
jgi:hypothetical protein